MALVRNPSVNLYESLSENTYETLSENSNGAVFVFVAFPSYGTIFVFAFHRMEIFLSLLFIVRNCFCLCFSSSGTVFVFAFHRTELFLSLLFIVRNCFCLCGIGSQTNNAVWLHPEWLRNEIGSKSSKSRPNLHCN